MATNVIIATDEMLAALNSVWPAKSLALYNTFLTGATPARPTVSTAPVLIFEPLEKGVSPHPSTGALPWARVTVRHATGFDAAIGLGGNRKRFRRTGTLWLQCFAPNEDGSGWGLSRQLAMIGQSVYQGARTVNVTFNNVALIERGQDGSFYRTDITAQFKWDELQA